MAGLLSCGGGRGHGDLVVTSFSPSRPTDDAQAVEIHFDHPVVADSQVGTPVDTGTVTVTPALAWDGHWRDRQTLVIEPREPLKKSTTYKVALAGELAKRTDDFSFTFIHAPLAVEGVFGVDVDAIPIDGELTIGFNQPVGAAALAEHCALVDRSGSKVALKPRDAAAVDAQLIVTPATALAPDGTYTLTCSELAGDGGDATLAEPYALALHARPNLFVARVTPDGWDVAADEVTVELTFSTTVTLDAVRAALSAKPAIVGLDKGVLDASGKKYRLTADLETETEYAINVANLGDVFGQKLAAPFTHTFTTGDARPRISMERGIFALEASAKGYPLWSRNVKQYMVECAAIPRAKLVQLLTTEMNYDPWGGNDDYEPIGWKALGVVGRKTAVTVPGAKNKWHLDDLDLGATCGASTGARGVFLADVSSKDIIPDEDRPWMSPRNHRVLANVTDFGVMIKVGPASGLVWVTSLSTGKPVAGARVAVYSPQGKQVWVGISDASGLVRTPGSAVMKQQASADDTEALEEESEDWEDWDSYRSQRMIAIVEKDGDTAIVDGNWANGIQVWNFGVPEERRGGVTQIRGFIQSDRGLYRPGEDVHFKGLVREIAVGRPPRVPTKQGAVEIEVADSRGATVLSTTGKLTEFGGFSFDLSLGKEAALGDYYVTAKVADQVFRERFMVEEFRPAAFEVGVEGSKRIRPGERMAFTVDARYLFGAPVTAANVEWNVQRRAHSLHFKGYDEFSFDQAARTWWDYDYDGSDYASYVSDGSGETSDHGRYKFAVRDPASDLEGPQDYLVAVNVTDETDQTIGKSVVVTAHKNEFYLGMHTQEYVQAVAMPFGVNLVALTPEGARVGAKATLRFIRDTYDCTWTEYGARSSQSCTSHKETAIERQVDVPANGTGMERIYPKEPGEYLIELESKDSRGNVIKAASRVWVIGKGEAFWSGDEGDRMTLIASKQKYAPGETARLVAQANLVTPTALITVERDGIIDAWVKPLASASEGVEIPIKDAYAPNVFASVALVSGRHGDGDRNRPQFKMGLVELGVTTAHKQLDVAITTERDGYRPGEKVTGKLKVTSHGQPVRAELSLSVADEGVLQLIAYQTPNPMKTFYATWGLGIDTGTNWNRIARLADPASGDPDEGGDSGSGDDEQRVRSKFVSSAFWAPALVTDGNGEVAFTFTAPDNLTAFRLMAVAADVADRFGSGEKRITISKPLMARPALPRFLRSGDHAVLGVVLTNKTGVPGTATVTAKASGVELASTKETVSLAAGGTARVRFNATVPDNAAATIEFAVVMGNERDALKVTLPIERPRIIDTRTVSRTALDAGKPVLTAELGIARDVLRDESELVVTVDRTGLGDLEPSLRYLVEYPYGCLEQTLSRFLPLVAARDLAGSLDLPSLKGTKANAFIKAGVAKVIRHQQGDGHFSLWPQSQTYPHLTVYALWGLREAKAAGADVPAEPMTRALAAIQSWVAAGDALKPDGDGATLAMAAYLLAASGKPDAGLDGRLYDMRAGLPRYGLAFLLRALSAAKADPKMIAAVRDDLAKAMVTTAGASIIHETQELSYYMNDDVRATAMTLAALLEVLPQDPMIPALVAGLDKQRGSDGAWRNTQDNVWSLIALAQYARRAAAGSTTVTITAGGQQLSKKKLSGGEVNVVRTRLDKLSGDKVSVSADGGAHVSVRVVEKRRDAGEASSHGFRIQREYLGGDGKVATRFAPGDLVTVRLTVETDVERAWVAMVDPMPAGFEAVNTRLATSVDTQATTARPSQPGWRNQMDWDHQEQRDNEVRWFADRMWRGSYIMTYQARATIAGTFSAMPARIEAMYEPSVMGRTASTSVTVTQ